MIEYTGQWSVPVPTVFDVETFLTFLVATMWSKCMKGRTYFLFMLHVFNPVVRSLSLFCVRNFLKV